MAEKLNETASERTKSNVSNKLISDYMREAAESKRAIDEATAVHRTILKRAKASGVNQRALLEALSARKNDPDKVIMEMKDTIRYLEIGGIPLSKSGLFDNLTAEPVDERTQEERGLWAAEEAGYNCGIANGARDDNVFAPGLPTHAKWDEGFLRGKKALAGQTTAADKPASTRRTRNRAETLN